MSVLTAKKWSTAYAIEWIETKLHDLGGRCPGPCGERFIRYKREHIDQAGSLLAQWRTAKHNSEASIDHIVPRSKGGTNRNDNLTIMCRRCNMNKSDSVPVESNLWHGWS